MACPACGSSDSGCFGYGVQRNCWNCGAVWRSPPPSRKKTRWDSLEEAVTITAILGLLAAVGLLGLYWLLVGIVIIGVVAVVAPVFLIPPGLVLLVVAFFYILSRRSESARSS